MALQSTSDEVKEELERLRAENAALKKPIRSWSNLGWDALVYLNNNKTTLAVVITAVGVLWHQFVPGAVPIDPVVVEKMVDEAVKSRPKGVVTKETVIREVPFSPGIVKSNKE